MATSRIVLNPMHLIRRRCEDRLSTSSNQPCRVESNFNYRSSKISPAFLSPSIDVVTANHAYSDRVNLSNKGNHGNSKVFKSKLENIFSSVSSSSDRSPPHSVSSQSSGQNSFDDSPYYTPTLPEPKSAYNEESVYETYPFADEQCDDTVFVSDTNSPETLDSLWSFDDMDNPDPERDVYGREDTQPIERDGIYVNIPHIEEPVYDEPEGFERIVQPSVKELDISQPNVEEEPEYDAAEGFGRIAQPAVKELISTEVSYVKSLRLLTDTIQPKLEEIHEVDVKSLFSNLNEILLVHESFLNELKKTEHDPQNQLIRIGSLFQDFSKDMENVYSVYCTTHTRSTSLFQYYQEIHVAELIQNAIKSALSGSSSHYTDLTFYLIMPVQRITKYPLLLQKILSTVTQNKESSDALQRANHTMEEVNANVNENKRRKEVAGKYLRSDQRTIRDKMSTVNIGTLSKKSQRISQFLKQQTGIVPKREDKEFDSLADRFHRLASMVSQMEKNVISYVKNVEEYFLIQPETYPMEYLHGSIHPLNGYILELHNGIYPAFKRRLQIMVLQPLINLSECLKGPKRLIRKRIDKLLDYENLEAKYSETGKMTWEEEDIVSNYKTIHAMLLSELPNCISLSYQLLHNIFLSFIAVQKDLAVQGCFAAEEHSSQMQCSTISEPQFRKWVEDCISYSLLQLNEFTKKFDEQLPVPVPQEHLPVIERQVQQLLKQYSPQKLYQVMSTVDSLVKSTHKMDLTPRRGDVVAVIQFADTKGNKNRWLVDTGGLRGYVPCSILQPYQETHNLTHSQSPTHNLGAMKTVGARRHTVASPVCPYPTYTQPQIVAGYSFTARSPHEVSITKGEPVIVLEPHDKNGSPEWSLVEVNGQRGYVPSNHLLSVPMQELDRRTSVGNYTQLRM